MVLKKTDDNELRNWGIGLIQAIKTVCEGKAEQPLFNDVIGYFENLIRDARTNRGLKSIIKEIELWALNLDPGDADNVNRIMFTNFGKALGEDSIFHKVNSIIKKGSIKNSTEFRLLIEVLDLYSDDNAKQDIIKSISQLVFKYEKERL